MRRLLFLIICLVVTMSLWADVVPCDEAKAVAMQFLQKDAPRRAKAKGRAAAASPEVKLCRVGAEQSYYVFNVGTDDGFVIVSGDDATEQILGYSYGGSLHPDSMPCGMRMLLDSYADQIKHLREKGINKEQNFETKRTKSNIARRSASSFHVDDSRLAHFGQGAPYYYDCPMYWTHVDFASGYPSFRKHYATGCAATAMSEIMYSHKWPKKTFASISDYVTGTHKIEVEGFPAGTTINWSNILDRYNDGRDVSGEQEDEIAKLMKIAGTSVRMDYGSSRDWEWFQSSSESTTFSYSIDYALQKYFGYSSTIEWAASYSESEWLEKIRTELDKGYPILYFGTKKKGGGHIFTLEGYDENDFFEVNLGWERSQEDKVVCKLRLFVKDNLSEVIEYNTYMGAFFGVEPQAGGSSTNPPLYLTPDSVYPNGLAVYQRSASSGKFDNVSLTLECYNFMPVDNKNYDIGVVLMRNGKQQGDIIPVGSYELPFNSVNDAAYKVPITFSCGQGLSGDVYKIQFVSKPTGTSTWNYGEGFNRVWTNAWICDDMMSVQSSDEDVSRLSALRVHINEQMKVGSPTQLSYMITPKGDDYDGAVIIAEKWYDENNVERWRALKIVEAHIGTGNNLTIPVTWTPDETGTKEICILNKQWNTIYSKQYVVAEADAPVDNLSVSNLTMENGSTTDHTIIGTTLKGTVTIANGDNQPYKGSVHLGLWNNAHELLNTYDVDIASGGYQNINFEFKNLSGGVTYRLRAYVGTREGATTGTKKQFYESPYMDCTVSEVEIPEDDDDPANYDLTNYEYWFDNDIDNHFHTRSLNGTVTTIDTEISTEELSIGLHSFHIRVQQSNGAYSPVSTTYFMKYGGSGGTAKKLEYWFDDDIAHSQEMTIPTAVDDEGNTIMTLNLTDFPVGYHQLNYRVSGSHLSAINTAGVFKMPAGGFSKLEYWLDDNLDGIQRISGTNSSAGALFTSPFDLSNASAGLHRLNYRTIDADNVPSSAIYTSLVYKHSGDTYLEYWFDDEFSTNRTRINGTMDGKDLLFDNIVLNLNAVSPGLHRLYYRTVSSTGQPGSAVSMTPVMLHSRYNVDGSQLTVTGYSVSVDGGTEEVHTVINPLHEVEQSYTLDARNLNKGEHILRVSAWNSIGAKGSEEAKFTVNEVQAPTVTLTVTENDGLVKLQFNSVPNDLRYRIIRTDANGVKAKVDSKEGSSYPAIVSFTDNPVAGTYTYYVQTAYTDYNGSRHSLLSNEVSVTIAEPQPEEVTVDEYGYITGTLVCDKDAPTYGTYVQFSDGITARVNGTLFSRTKVPVGTELEITVNGDVTHEYETKTVTIVRGENRVTINGTLIDENRANNYANDLTFDSDLGIDVIDGSQYAKFSIKNLSYDKSWTGVVRIKAVEKDKANKKGIDIESASYETTTIKVCDSPIFEIGKNKSKEISVSLKKLKVKKDTEYVLYFESIGKLTNSNGEDICKAIAANTSYNTSVNPLVETIGVTGSETQQWDDEARQRFASFIVGVSSLVPGINGNVGDLSPYYKKALSTAKMISGVSNDESAIQTFFNWMAGKSAWEIINEPNIMSATSFIFDVYSNVKSYGNGTMVQKYWNDVFGASYDYGSAQLVISDLALLAHASIGKDPIEATTAVASTIYSLVYPTTSAGAIPYAAMMYSYTVVGRALVAKILEYAAIMRSRYIVTRLKANKPYNGNDENRQNTAVDFKLVVKTKNWIGSSAINFQEASASSQISSISVLAAHQRGNEPAEFSFIPVFMKDCVMLQSDGKGITNNKSLDDMNELKELYMKIVWSNGRETLIPLNEETSGVEINFKGTDAQGVDHFEDFKPLVYTVTLTTTTGKDHIADEFYLGNNKNRE